MEENKNTEIQDDETVKENVENIESQETEHKGIDIACYSFKQIL